MIRQNLHIHSEYSWDSKMSIDEIAKNLVSNQIQYAAITDHVEFDREPLSYVITKFKIRNKFIDSINEKYNGKLKLLKAVEISSPHLYKEKVDALQEVDLDFIMGSIHQIDKSAKTNIEINKSYRKYYEEVLKMVESKQIDIVGHLDYINRYYGWNNSCFTQINEIFEAINENNQVIEINTSAARRCNLNIFPSLDKICIYKLSNSNVTIGTDAHQYSELTDNLEQAELIAEELKLTPIIYQKRKRIIL